MKNKNYISLLFFLLSSSSASYAQVITDGSLGAATTLSGPDFAIGQQLGSLQGNNLFHSFSTFNIAENQSAVFSGQASIANIIARITNGETSSINGLLKSTIAEADLYLLNPAGIVFGPGANLDLGGSFYTSTADFLQFADGEKFYSQALNSDVLSVSSPFSFGFLDSNTTNSNITISGSQLYLAEEKTLAVIAKDVLIDQQSDIFVPSGQVNIAAVRGQAEVPVKLNSINELNISNAGSIQVLDGSIIEVSNNESSGLGSGSIFIRAGNFVLDNKSHLFSVVDSNTAGKQIAVKADNISILQQSSISSISAAGNAKGGDISLEASNALIISGGSSALGEQFAASNPVGIVSNTQGNGQAGNIYINANSINLNNYAAIDMASFGVGDAGKVVVNSTNAVKLIGYSKIFADAWDAGEPGSVEINAGSLTLADNSSIDVGNFSLGKSVISLDNLGASSAGSVKIAVKDDVSLSDNSSIYADTFGIAGGGSISISAKNLLMNSSSSIETSSKAFKANEQTFEIEYSQNGSGFAGDININATDSVLMNNNATITSASLWDFEQNVGIAGDAGFINIQAGKDIVLSDNALISSEAANSGGGVLTLTSGNQLYFLNSEISSSVLKSVGNGGDINVDSPNFVVLNKANIIAQAYEGSGGNIHIITKNFVQASDSIVDASSQLGIDGTIDIESPNIDYENNAQVLATRYLDTTQWQQQPCATKTGEQVSSFIVADRKGVASLPDDMMSISLDDVMELEFKDSKPVQMDIAIASPAKLSCEKVL